MNLTEPCPAPSIWTQTAIFTYTQPTFASEVIEFRVPKMIDQIEHGFDNPQLTDTHDNDA